MHKPRLLDLFCGEGGAGMGYAMAGFDVVGVDLMDRNRYPFHYVQADAMTYLDKHAWRYDVIHASPPCQAYSISRHTSSKEHPELIEPIREQLTALGKPYVIENVVGAPLRSPIQLCGSEFGLVTKDTDGVLLQLQRHRLFESNRPLSGNGGCRHLPGVKVAGVYGGGRDNRTEHRDSPTRRGGYTPDVDVRRDVMRIGWMTRNGLSQAIPPSYTEHLGLQLKALL